MTRKSIITVSVLFAMLSANTVFAMMGGMGGSSSGGMNSQQHDQYMNNQNTMSQVPQNNGNQNMDHAIQNQQGGDHENMNHEEMNGDGSNADAFFKE
jgi:hypothetical protein